MNASKAVADVIAELRKERIPLTARLDAIDLAIDNLNRIYGLNGTPQPLPLETLTERRKKPRIVPAMPRDGEAEGRRQQVLTVLGRSPVGMTAAELAKQTPKMDTKDRSNALTVLKAKGLIRRAGNTWVKASEAA